MPLRLRTCLAALGFCVLGTAFAAGDTAVRVTDINPGPANSGPIHPIVSFGGKLYFPGQGPSTGRELYSYDGANPPVLFDIQTGPGDGDVADLVVFEGALLFTADSGAGTKIWRYDGVTPPAVAMPLGEATDPRALTAFGDWLVFLAYSEDHGDNLWKWNGVDPVSLVSDIGPENQDEVENVTPVVFGSKLLFVASLSGNQDIWQWDGVNAPTALPGPATSNVDFGSQFAEVAGFAVWGNSDPLGSGQTVLWKWNGVAAPATVGSFDLEGGMGVHNGAVYFTALNLAPGSETEREIWRYDGTNTPTRIAPNVEWGITFDFTSFNGSLYFLNIPGGAFVGDVWKYDGVNPPILDPNAWPAPSDRPERGFTPLGEFLYLSADTTDAGVELWRIDPEGGPAGPAPTVSAVSPTSGPASGGTPVTITGTEFVAGASATVVGVSTTGVNVGTPQSITATTGAMVPGTLGNVTVTNVDAQTGILPAGFLSDFLDMPQADIFHSFVEKLVRNGVTAGCGSGNYCRNTSVTRGQMAVFLLKSKLGASYLPPQCTGDVFDDVLCNGGIFDKWIEDLAGRGITGGCGGGNYCPLNPVTRAQMSVFLLKSLEGSAYTPPACDGTVFDDVPCSGGTFDPWIEELASRAITSGCSTLPPLYCPTSPNTRGQMAVFLVKTFGLP